MTKPRNDQGRRERFVEEYVKDRNGTQAAIRAGYSPRSAAVQASILLREPKILEMISVAKAAVSQAVVFEAADVLKQWVDLATADPGKISRVRWVNCRHCWGVGHEYQWKAREYAEACDLAMNAVDKTGKPRPRPAPKCDGGFGFVRNREPNPDCPECDGDGKEETIFADTNTLGPKERLLLAGVRRTKDGLEVKLRDRDAALRNIAGYLGMLVDKREVTGKDGGPLMGAVMPLDMPKDPALLAQLYGKLVG